MIDYCFLSEAMKSLPKLDWLRKGSLLPERTETARLAAQREAVLAKERVADEVDVRKWLGGTRRTIVSEESIGLGQYGKVLTILVSNLIGQVEDLSDDENEDDIIESWTPRFRR